MKYILVIMIFLSACTEYDHESYQVLLNSIPAGGPTINYDPESTLTNIEKITSELSKNESDIFNESLGWYGTESDFDFNYIHGKTAMQLVNIVNCLKVTKNDDKPLCFK